MILNRIVARMAVVEALTNFFTAPYPTIAEHMIFDSKIEPNEELEGQHPKPVAVVYTDYDKDFMIYKNKLQAHRMMTITIEFLVVQASQEVNEKNEWTGRYFIESPFTDSELEMSLDIFEGQAFSTLAGDSPAASAFQYLVQGYENVISRRGAAVTGGQRLSARQVTIECDILRDPKPGFIAPEVDAFLTAVEERDADGYGDRAKQLRSMYLSDGGLSGADKVRRIMGLSPYTGGMLGYVPGIQTPLGGPIVFLDPQGKPL